MKNLARALKGAMGLGFTLMLASCFETKQEYTLNPNGTGKVVHECSFQNVNLNNDGDQDTEEALRAAVRKIVNESKGVDAWRDVSFKMLDDGRMWFRGTAYFRNLSELEIPNQSTLGMQWKRIGKDKAELVLDLKSDADAKETAKTENLTADERAAKLKTERAKFQQAKPMFTAMLGGMKQSVSFRLPGKVVSSSNFKTGPTGTQDLVFEGSKMLEAMDTLIADDEWLAENAFDAQESPALDDRMAALLFGENAPVKTSVSGPLKPFFNYAAEVAAAQKEFPKIEKQLGVVSIAPPAEGEPLKSIKVVGVRIVSPVDEKLGLRPFNDEVGYTLSILAELPGSVLDITDKSRLNHAAASDGTDLLKGDRDWDRRLGFPKLSEDKASVLFDVGLKLPPPTATGVKEVSGVIQYRVAGGSKETDLGLKSLTVGSKGKPLGASIEKIKEGWQKDGSEEMELRLRLNPDDLKSASLLVDGVKTALKQSGYSSSGGVTTFTLSHESAFPENGSIVVETYDQVKTFDVPFKLENLSLLGTPAASGN